MNSFLEISILLVSTIFDHVNLFLTSLSEAFFTSEAGSGVALALAVGAVAYSSISEGVLAGIRKWHGSIDDQFGNIDNLVNSHLRSGGSQSEGHQRRQCPRCD